MKNIKLIKLKQLPINDLQPLLEDSREQGFEMVDQLVTDYINGSNQFRKPGEALFGVYCDQRLIAIGGLNHDPYLADGETGRVRRVYVLASWRGQGVGKLLVQRIIDEARRHYCLLTLRAMTEAASQFYDAIGFQTKPEVYEATHHLVLT